MAEYSPKPVVEKWYKNLESNQLFEVVAIDEDEDTIEIQYFDAEIEELDQDTWDSLDIIEAAEPEDWTAPYELDREDRLESDSTQYPEDWSGPLTDIEPEDLD